MKVPIDEYACINLGAPTLPAYERVKRNGVVQWLVYCKHCDQWHRHGAGEGHREAHCIYPISPYHATGYNLAFAGELPDGAAERRG